jgi:hypothetical protein
MCKRDQSAGASGKTVESVDRNPVFQQMRVSLADAEANVASLRAAVGVRTSTNGSGRRREWCPGGGGVRPAQPRYDVQKKTYGDLARREAATMGVDVQDTGGTQFRVIDPPRVAPQPVPPTRVALLGIAFAVALGAGLLASFVASELMPTFHDARTLRAVTERPILGMVSMLPNESVRRKQLRNVFMFAGGLSGLIASFTAVLAFALLMGRVA